MITPDKNQKAAGGESSEPSKDPDAAEVKREGKDNELVPEDDQEAKADEEDDQQNHQQMEKQIKFYIASTGEVIHSIRLAADETLSEEDLEDIRQKLAFDTGIEMNSIQIASEEK